jgi:pyridoxine 5-phosphate synthase
VTTEGGLDVLAERKRLLVVVPKLRRRGGEVSLFVDPDPEQIQAAAEVGAEFVELHTGSYARAKGAKKQRELERLASACVFARGQGLRVNAGHGLDYDNVEPVAALPFIEELNIGFAIVARSVFVGVDEAVSSMARLVRSSSRSKVTKPAVRARRIPAASARRSS